MDQESIIELGNVTNLRIAETSELPGTYSMFFRSPGGEEQQCLFTDGAIRLLWHFLTQILYPRAADSLTSKSATATYSLTASPSAIFALKVIEKDGQIEITGMSTIRGWSFILSPEDAQELWASLEDALQNV